MRQQPLTHWSMPTHAASLSPFLVPLTPREQPHSFRERSSPFVAQAYPLFLFHWLFSSHILWLAWPSFSFSSVALYRFISHRTPNPLSNLYPSLSHTHDPLFPTPFVSTLLRCGSRASDGPTDRRLAGRSGAKPKRGRLRSIDRFTGWIGRRLFSFASWRAPKFAPTVVSPRNERRCV